MNKLFYFALIAIASMAMSCTKEGPMGPPGVDGVDANESCKQCHNQAVVEAVSSQYHYSLHMNGEAYEEGTRNNCAVCHSHQGFTDVCTKNTPATFSVSATDPLKYVNNYVASASALTLPGKISCSTCHSSLHTTYAGADLSPLTNDKTVSMTMWGGAKSIDFKNSGNLCAKCHQPRPITGSNGNVIDYAVLVANPTANYTLSTLSYRTGVHYGAHGAIVAGVGGIEMNGLTVYSNSTHAEAKISCQTCHMAEPSGFGGGHSFKMVSSSETSTTKTINASGCNTTGCHTGMSEKSGLYTDTQTEIKGLIKSLGDKIGPIMQKDPSTGLYNGYLDIYDASANPTGTYKNPTAGNLAVPTITNAKMAGIINLQLTLRESSYGVHNYAYSKALLENSIAAIN